MRPRFIRFAGTALAVTLAACSSDETTNPDVGDRLEFRAVPTVATAGRALEPEVVVVVVRQDGSVATGVEAVVRLSAQSPGDADTLRGTRVAAVADGVAAFTDLVLNRVSPGTRLVATSPGLTGAISEPIAVRAGAASTLEFSGQPDTVEAGAPLGSLQVVARDVGGNVATTTNRPVTLAISSGPAGAAIAGTTTVDLVNGVASFSAVALPRAGAGYTLQATAIGDASIASATTRTFVVRAAAADSLVFSVEPTATVVGTEMLPPVQVSVVDAFGNRVTTAAPAITLSLFTAPTGFGLDGELTVTAVNGIATFRGLTPTAPAGTVRLRATAAGVASAVSAVFSAGVPAVRSAP